MTEIVKNCPLCGSWASSLFDRRQFRGHTVINQICSTCGLVYQSPRMTQAESEAFYMEEYRLLYQGQAGPSYKDLTVQGTRAEATLSFIQPWIQQASRVLDIGCSAGVLLRQLQSHYQAKGVGVEPGELYRQYAQALGLEVHPTLDDLESTQPARFDLISLMHVLEHLSDPVGYLQRIGADLLQPQGWLLVEVPNLYAHDCFEVAHMLSFSPHILVQVIRKAGFCPVRLRRHGSPRSRLIPLYLTLLSRPDGSPPDQIKPERLVRYKRQAGFFQRRVYTRLFPARAWLPIPEQQPEGKPSHA